MAVVLTVKFTGYTGYIIQKNGIRLNESVFRLSTGLTLSRTTIKIELLFIEYQPPLLTEGGERLKIRGGRKNCFDRQLFLNGV